MIKMYFSNKGYKDSKKFIREILAEYLGLGGSNLSITVDHYGKPYLSNFPNVHFNISHTKGAIVGVISDKPVGIDIELVKKFNKRIAERFFTENEQLYIFSDEDNQDDRFAEIWTRKEAYVKFLGKGMCVPFESFDVCKLNNNIDISTLPIGKYIISLCISRNHAI